MIDPERPSLKPNARLLSLLRTPRGLIGIGVVVLVAAVAVWAVPVLAARQVDAVVRAEPHPSISISASASATPPTSPSISASTAPDIAAPPASPSPAVSTRAPAAPVAPAPAAPVAAAPPAAPAHPPAVSLVNIASHCEETKVAGTATILASPDTGRHIVGAQAAANGAVFAFHSSDGTHWSGAFSVPYTAGSSVTLNATATDDQGHQGSLVMNTVPTQCG